MLQMFIQQIIKKQYIFLIVFILLISSTLASLDNGLILYWSADLSLESEVSDITLINNTAKYDIDGKNNASFYGDGTGDELYNLTYKNYISNDYSISLWFNTSQSSSSNRIILANYGQTGGNDGFFCAIRRNDDGSNPNKLYCRNYENTVAGNEIYSIVANDGVYHHLAVVINDTDNSFHYFIDSTKYGEAQSITTSDLGRINFLNKEGGTVNLNGCVDEIAIWNKTLSQAEVNNLNNGNYTFFETGGGTPPTPTLTINHNLANTKNVNENLNFTYNGTFTNTNNPFNCTLYVDNILNQTNNNVNISVLQNFYFDVTGLNANFSINITCENSDISDNTESYYYAIDTILPQITMVRGFTNNTNLIKDNTLLLEFNFTDTNLLAYNITIFDVNDIEQENIFATNLTSTSYINISTRTLSSLGNYSVRAEAWDSHTNNKVKPIKWFYNDNVIVIDTSLYFKGEIKEDKTEFYLSEDRYKIKITWEEDSYIHYLNITSDKDLIFLPKSKYRGHFIYNYERWVDFENDNIKKITINQIKNGYRLKIELFEESDEIEFESIGDLNYNSYEWTYNVLSQDTAYLSSIDENLENILEVIELMPYIILYIFFMVFGYNLMRTGNLVSGIALYMTSIGFDFYLVGYYWNKFFPNLTFNTITGVFNFVFVLGLIVWLFMKVANLVALRKPIPTKN